MNMRNLLVLKSKPLRRWALWGGLGLVWLVSLLGAAVPAWHEAHSKHLEIQDLEARLSEMDRWTVAGLWLERSVAANTRRIDQSWDRVFPGERDREELFLQLAVVADGARVEDFNLFEVEDSGMQEDHLWLDRPDGDIDEWMSGQIQGVNLGFYRVKASFRGDYQRVARFLGGINSIERAMSIHSLDVQPDDQGVKVEMRLDVYVRETTES